MRTIVVLGFVAASALLGATPSRAYEGPWCAKINIGGGVTQDHCGFATFEACRQEIYINGPTTQCTQNPRFLPYWQGRGEPQRRIYIRPHKRRHHQY